MFIITAFVMHAQWSTDPNNNLIVGYGLDPHICSDSAGGCYFTYDYENIYYPRKLALERLDKYGYKPWGTLKQILGELPEQSHAEIIEDGESGVIVSYEDRFEDLPNTEQRVRLQRVDSSGNSLWGTTGVKVTLEEINHGKQQLVTDGNGGAVVGWVNTFDQYKVNRINSEGQRVWGDSGIMLTSGSNEQPIVIKAADGNYYLQAGTIIYRINQNGEILKQFSSTILGQPVPDPEGGVVVSGLVWTGMIPKLVAQRKDSLGNNLWQEPYVVIADSLYYINPRFNIQCNDGYYYYGWSGTKYGIVQVAQYQALRQDGSKLFPQGSVQISNNAPIGRPYIISSDSGRTIFVWNDATITSSTIAQMYDTLGNKLWNENGIVVSYPAIAYENTTDGQGGFITIGPINQFTIIAQQVNKYGYLGEIITSIPQEDQEIFPTEIILYQNYPNPFNSITNISYSIPKEGRIRIVLYNILGENLKTISDEYKSIGTYSISFNADNLPSGVYFYTLETDNQVLSKKLTILK
ncbi:MAG: T9SS type A sorting domain-containing protein [bacterium]|nr:T9SS type A sorting domain-containing protein [bacterium]